MSTDTLSSLLVRRHSEIVEQRVSLAKIGIYEYGLDLSPDC